LKRDDFVKVILDTQSGESVGNQLAVAGMILQAAVAYLGSYEWTDNRIQEALTMARSLVTEALDSAGL